MCSGAGKDFRVGRGIGLHEVRHGKDDQGALFRHLGYFLRLLGNVLRVDDRDCFKVPIVRAVIRWGDEPLELLYSQLS